MFSDTVSITLGRYRTNLSEISFCNKHKHQRNNNNNNNNIQCYIIV